MAISTRGATRGINTLRTSLFGVQRRNTGLADIAAILGALAAASALAAPAVIGVAGALGVLGAAGATIAVATNGVVDAFKALSKASKDTSDNTKEVASAQRGVTTAQRGVRDAVRAVADAQRGEVAAGRDLISAQKQQLASRRSLNDAYKEAQRTFRDLDLQVRGARISEKEAALDLAEARRDVFEAAGDPAAAARARLRVERAELSLAEATRRNRDVQVDANEAQRKGIEGSDQVVSAREALAQANERVTDSEEKVTKAHEDSIAASERVADAQDNVAAAQDRVTEAMGVTSKAAQEAQRALEKLSPAAQEFVLGMRALGPEATKFRETIQEAFFTGLTVPIQDLVRKSLPSLQAGMTATAGSLNTMLLRTTAFFSQDQTQSALQKSFESTGKFLDGLSSTLGPAAQGFVDFFNNTETGIGRLGQSFGNFSSSIGEFFSEISKDGRANQLFEIFSTQFESLGKGLSDVLRGFTTIALKSGNSIGPLFEQVGRTFREIAPTLGELGKSFAENLTKLIPDLGGFLENFGSTIVKILPSVEKFFSALLKGLGSASPELGDALIKLLDTLTPFIPKLAELAEHLLPLVAQTLGGAAPIFRIFLDAVNGLVQGFEKLGPIATGILLALGGVVALASIQKLIAAFGRLGAAAAGTIRPIVGVGREVRLAAINARGGASIANGLENVRADAALRETVARDRVRDNASLNQQLNRQEVAARARLTTASRAADRNDLRAREDLNRRLTANVNEQARARTIEDPTARARAVEQADRDQRRLQTEQRRLTETQRANSSASVSRERNELTRIRNEQDAARRGQRAAQTELRDARRDISVTDRAIAQRDRDERGTTTAARRAAGDQNAARSRAGTRGLTPGSAFISSTEADRATRSITAADRATQATSRSQRALGAATRVAGGGFRFLRGAIASTGLGLILIFLPQIIELFKKFFTQTELGRAIVEKLKIALTAIKGAFADVVRGFKGEGNPEDNFFTKFGATVQDVWEGVLIPLWQGLQRTWVAIFAGDEATGDDFFTKFGQTIRNVWDNVIIPIFNGIKNIWEGVFLGDNAEGTDFFTRWGQTIRKIYDNVIVPAFLGIKDFITGFISGGGDEDNQFTRLGAKVRDIWENVVKPALAEFWAFIQDTLIPAIQDLIGALDNYWNVISTVWNAVGAVISGVWNTFISPIFTAIGLGLDVIKGAFGLVRDVVTETWNALATVIEVAWTNAISPAWEAMKSGLGGLRDFFTEVVNGIGNVWNGIKAKLAAPVNFFINTVYTGGIKRAWDAVAGFLHLDGGALPTINPIAENKDGGFISGKGGPRDDKILSWLSNGEYVLPARAVQRIGKRNLDKFLAGTGSTEGMFGLGAFASGGAVAIEEAFKRAHAFAKGEAGKPYQYSGFGNPSWDCSGIWSGVYNVLQGRGPTQGVRFNTENVEEFGFIPGLKGPVTIGVLRQGGGPLSHMAGTLQGQNIESSGGDGVEYGPGAHGSGQFPLRFTLSDFGGLYKDGGGGILDKVTNFFRDKLTDVFEIPVNKLIGSIPGGDGWTQVPKALGRKVADGFFSFLRGKADGQDDVNGVIAAPPGSGVERWRSLAMQALVRTGYVPPENFIEAMLSQIGSESGGNPSIVQGVIDVNSGGQEGVGLLQIIPNTFAAFRDPSLPNDRRNPFANMVAALRYMRSPKYNGDINGVWGHGHGYRTGGFIGGPGSGDIVPAMLEPGEFVMNRSAVRRFGPLLSSINSAVPRFQEGGPVGDLLGSLGVGPIRVFVVNFAELGTNGVSSLAPAMSAGVSAAAPDVGSAVTDAVSGVTTGLIGEVGDAVAGTLTDANRGPADFSPLDTSGSTAIEAKLDEQGNILSDTKDQMARSASSQSLVFQEGFRRLQEGTNSVIARLVPGVLIPVVQSGVDQAIRVVQGWLGAGFGQVTEGTNRTTDAIEGLDTGTEAAPAFGLPGSAFDAVTAISGAVVQVADTAKQAFEKIAQDIANAALAQVPSRVTGSRGNLGTDVSGGPLTDMLVRLTGAQIEIANTLINTLDMILEFRKDLVQEFDSQGNIISDTAALMQRNESSQARVLAEQNRINRELIKAVLKFLVLSVILPILTAVLGVMIQVAVTAIGAAIGSIIPGIGTAIGAAIGAIVGAALAGAAAVFTSVLAVGAGAALDSFDSGGMVRAGPGFLFKGNTGREMMLPPEGVEKVERFMAGLDRVTETMGERRTEIHAPITINGASPQTGERVRGHLLSKMPR